MNISGDIPLIVEVSNLTVDVFYSMFSKKVAVINSRWYFCCCDTVFTEMILRIYVGFDDVAKSFLSQRWT